MGCRYCYRRGRPYCVSNGDNLDNDDIGNQRCSDYAKGDPKSNELVSMLLYEINRLQDCIFQLDRDLLHQIADLLDSIP